MYDGIDSDLAIKEANANGWDVVSPAEDELQIDIDDDAAYAVWTQQRRIVDEHVGILSVRESPSKSNHPEKRHLTVKVARQLSAVKRILLQAVLGSDLKREALSFVRTLRDDPHPTLFLEARNDPSGASSSQ